MFFLRNIKQRSANYNILRSGPRKCLEFRLFPYFHDSDDFQTILLVGVAPCTQHYGEYFKHKKAVYSIDVDPKRAAFGVPGYHTTDFIENIEKYFKDNYFDSVLMNGVYGWGLDKEESLIKAIGAIKRILRRGGVLLFGWDKVPKYDPLDLDSKSYFRDFVKIEISGASRIELDNKHHHIFDFYRKL
jgi:SAM-dependent methyltransferase